MNLAKRYPILGSSVDPEKVSMTIKGFGLALVPAILAIARLAGLEIVENDLVMLVNSIATIASMGMVVYGLFRKYFK